MARAATPRAVTRGRVLVIAGSDSGGGAGIQADIKTVTALRGYAMTAVTALTAQDTEGVHAIHPVPADFIAKQISVVLQDIGADAIKTGMLHSAEVIEIVVATLEKLATKAPLVVDPVMVAKGGQSLLLASAVKVLKSKLVPLATVLTPNLPEAEALAGVPIRTLDDLRKAGLKLLDLGPKAVLMKGGHGRWPQVHDALVMQVPVGDPVVEMFKSARLDSRHTHGTGCTLASAIATGLAQGMEVRDAVARARAYVHKAIAQAPGFGRGHGPLDHAHTVGEFKWQEPKG
ncbi:MAG: bifunctional hydroxymethylpyrimidine kinase/phosphomethylpyrimidine kinase [Alphaproteobacteria bacterium]|nr:bifunctional hydroxymethylpyrimidine kinase/phosphomethylpyrimidine kinase [Alphaproteobacteria bacterium]